MKMPAIMFGTGVEVHRPVGRWMKQVKKAMAWQSPEEGDWLETKEVAPQGSGINLMFEINPAIGDKKAFRIYAPFRYFKFDQGTSKEVFLKQNNLLFDALLPSTWGLLALMVRHGYVPSMEVDPIRCRQFFQRLSEDWELILAERHLFVSDQPGPFFGRDLWNSASSGLWKWMVRGGVPNEVIQSIPLGELGEYQVVEWIERYVLK